MFFFFWGGGVLFSPSIFILYYLELEVGLLFGRPLLANSMSIVITYIILLSIYICIFNSFILSTIYLFVIRQGEVINIC